LLSNGNGMWLKACLKAGIRVMVWRKGRDRAVKKKFWMKNVMSISRYPPSTPVNSRW